MSPGDVPLIRDELMSATENKYSTTDPKFLTVHHVTLRVDSLHATRQPAPADIQNGAQVARASIAVRIQSLNSNDAPKFRRATGESVYFSDQALPNSVAKNQALQDAIKHDFEPQGTER